MDKSMEKAFERVLAKVSALRKTLPTDEQEILDVIVSGEVEGHLMSADKVAAEKVAIRKTTPEKVSTADDASEIALHGMTAKSAPEKAAAEKVALSKSAVGRISFNDAAKSYQLKTNPD